MSPSCCSLPQQSKINSSLIQIPAAALCLSILPVIWYESIRSRVCLMVVGQCTLWRRGIISCSYGHPWGLEHRRRSRNVVGKWWEQQHRKIFFVLQGSWEAPRDQEHRTGSCVTGSLLPLLPHSPEGLSLGPGGESPSVLVQGGYSGGRVWFGGSKCPLKEIKVISQIHEDGSLSRRYREMELPFMIWLTLNTLRNLSEPQYLHLYRWGDNHTSCFCED